MYSIRHRHSLGGNNCILYSIRHRHRLGGNNCVLYSIRHRHSLGGNNSILSTQKLENILCVTDKYLFGTIYISYYPIPIQDIWWKKDVK